MKLIDILESLNYRTDIVWDGINGKFNINNQQFVVSIRAATTAEQQTYIQFFGKNIKVATVDFSTRLVDGSATQDLTHASGNTAMKVFSVVAQGVAEQTKVHGYDVVLCIAKRTASPTNYENRVSAYETIVDRAARKAGMLATKLYNADNETVYAVYKFDMFDDIHKLRQHLEANS
jgi:hypothetical protein